MPKFRQRGALRWMTRTIGGLLAGLMLIVLTVVVLGIPIELDWVKGKVETAAAETLGRPFAIEGPLT